jgi:hypothetical protein
MLNYVEDRRKTYNKKNIKSLNLTRKVNILRLGHGNLILISFSENKIKLTNGNYLRLEEDQIEQLRFL